MNYLKISKLTYSLLIIILFDSLALEAMQISIEQSFKLAIEKSDSLEISSEQIQILNNQISQVESNFFPSLSVQAAAMQQAESKNSILNNANSNIQSSSSVNYSQNLFQGFHDQNSIKQKKHLKDSSFWTKKMVQQQVYKDVAQAFYLLLMLQSDLILYQEQIDSTKKRKKELQQARKSGRARDSDILVIESNIANLDTIVTRIKIQIVSYQQSFTFLTGLDSEFSLIDNIKIPNNLNEINNFINEPEKRPDIQQAKKNLLAADDFIKVTQSSFFPVVNLNANYYLSRPSGLLQDVDWDVSIQINFPFYSGGLTKAQEHEALVAKHIKEINLRLTEKLANEAFNLIVKTIQADSDQYQKSNNAADLSYQSYHLVLRDNHLGVATNMDVLFALQTWQESKRNLEKARITLIFDYIKYLIESVQISDEGQIILIAK